MKIAGDADCYPQIIARAAQAPQKAQGHAYLLQIRVLTAVSIFTNWHYF